MARTLVTGGAGFVGSVFAGELLGRGHRVRALPLHTHMTDEQAELVIEEVPAAVHNVSRHVS